MGRNFILLGPLEVAKGATEEIAIHISNSTRTLSSLPEKRKSPINAARLLHIFVSFLSLCELSLVKSPFPPPTCRTPGQLARVCERRRALDDARSCVECKVNEPLDSALNKLFTTRQRRARGAVPTAHSCCQRNVQRLQRHWWTLQGKCWCCC